MIRSLSIITASTSGHTDMVLDVVQSHLSSALPHLVVRRVRAEQAQRSDIASSDAVVLGSGTWNTGGVEGQLNPHMHAFLFQRLAGASFDGKALAVVSLGDDRYYFTTRCTEHFLRFQRATRMSALCAPLIIVNEPYGQEERMLAWARKLEGALRGKSQP